MINDQRTGNFVEEGAPEQSIQGRAVLGRRGVEKVFQVGRSKQSGYLVVCENREQFDLSITCRETGEKQSGEANGDDSIMGMKAKLGSGRWNDSYDSGGLIRHNLRE